MKEHERKTVSIKTIKNRQIFKNVHRTSRHKKSGLKVLNIESLRRSNISIDVAWKREEIEWKRISEENSVPS